MKKQSLNRGGFALYMVIGSIAVVSLIVSGVLSYSVFALRSAASFTKVSECRLTGQTVLERAKVGINEMFKKQRRANPTSWDILGWFQNFTATSIGSGSFKYTLPQNLTLDGMTVSVSVREVRLPANTDLRQVATVRLQAVVTGTSDSGIGVSKSIEETIEYGLARSSLFNNAYFVNNFGWMYGGQCIVNGQARANGDFSIDQGTYVNGAIYAAPNQEIGAAGIARVNGGGIPKTMSIAEYWQKTGERTRPTTPPGNDPSINYPMGYDGTTTLNSYQEPVEMPFIGDLSYYKALAAAREGKVKIGGETVVDAVYNGVGPSGLETAPDKGCVTLIGTKSNPIVINGPVVVDRDVVISGYVSGQGTIYAGRNIHIVGNITYINPPSWKKPDQNPSASTEANQNKDMLGLVAKGNVVLGNPMDPRWYSDVRRYIVPPFVKPYACEPTDSSIGYPSTFLGNYTAEDGLQRVVSYEQKDGEMLLMTDKSHYYQSLVQDSFMGDGSRIARVDAVIYNNHAVMGRIGKCIFNGAIVCRDEALIFETHLDINWDARLGARSPDGMDFSIYLPYVIGVPIVKSWKEVVSL